MYNPYLPQYNPSDFDMSPWLRQQQQDASIPSQPYMGGITPPTIPPINQLSQSRSFFNPPPTTPPANDLPSSGGFGGNIGLPSSGLPQTPAMPLTSDIGRSDPNDVNAPVQDSPLMTRYKQLIDQPEGAAHSAYRDYLSRGYPNEANYEPSKWKKLGAGLVAGGLYFSGDPRGIQVGRDILDNPYRKAVTQYTAEGTRLSQAANEEDRQYQNQLKNVSGMVQETRAQSEDLHRRQQDKINQQKADSLERHRLAIESIDRIKVNKPDIHFFTQKGGHVWAVDAKDLTHPYDTGIDSGTLSDSDKLSYNLANSLEEIKARVKGAIQVKGTPGAPTTPSGEKWTPVSVFDQDPESPTYGQSTPMLRNEKGEIKPAEGVQGSFARPPKPPTTPGTIETTTETTPATPPESTLHKVGSALGVVEPPEQKPKTTVTTRKPITPTKQTVPDKNKIPAAAESKHGTTNKEGTTENYIKYQDDEGNYSVSPENLDIFMKSHPKAKRVSK